MKKLTLALSVLLLSVTAALAQFADQRNWGGTTSNSGNAYSMTVPNFPASPPVGVTWCAIANANNSAGGTTLNISGTGAANMVKPSVGGAVALTGGELITNQIFCVRWNPVIIGYQLASNDAQSATVVPTPQGYLTPCQITNGSPTAGCTAGLLLPTSDVTGTTALYYEPTVGNQVPVYNGSNMVPVNFSEVTLSIPSSRLASTLYDVYFFLNSGTPTLCMGVAWTTSTAGSGSRGNGASTAQIAQIDGIWTNAVSDAGCVNGGTTYTIPANQGTVLATCYMSANGQVTFNRTWGQSRQWDCQNIYNQQIIVLQAGDSTTSWTYSTNTPRPSRNQTSNSVTLVSALPLSPPIVTFTEQLLGSCGLNNCPVIIGIGWNSTSAFSGTVGTVVTNLFGASSGGQAEATVQATFTPVPNAGVNVATALENSPSALSVTFYGTQANMNFQCEMRM